MRRILRILILFLVLSFCFKLIPYKIINSNLENYYNDFNSIVDNNCKNTKNLNRPNKIYLGISNINEIDIVGECYVEKEVLFITN